MKSQRRTVSKLSVWCLLTIHSKRDQSRTCALPSSTRQFLKAFANWWVSIPFIWRKGPHTFVWPLPDEYLCHLWRKCRRTHRATGHYWTNRWADRMVFADCGSAKGWQTSTDMCWPYKAKPSSPPRNLLWNANSWRDTGKSPKRISILQTRC